MRYAILGASTATFDPADPFRVGATSPDEADALFYLGVRPQADPQRRVILVELGQECLAEQLDESFRAAASNVVGFARYRLGPDRPSSLVEVVRQEGTHPEALVAAISLFEDAGLTVAVCADRAGRIVDRLVRPKFNAALRLLDEGRATREDLDLACRLGLGYPEGPLERVLGAGLAHHHRVSAALYEATGQGGYAPARLALVAARRGDCA